MDKLINGVLLTRETVVVEHAGLVHMQCQRLKDWAKSLGQDYEDIKSVGFIGLINAFDRFDSDKYDNRFSTFATPQIWGTIQNFLASCSEGIHYPKAVKETAYKIRRMEMESLTAEEIAVELQESKNKVGFALEFLVNGRPARLDKNIGDEDNELAGAFGAPDDNSGIYVNEFLDTLTTNEREVIIQLMSGVRASDIARMRNCGPSYIGYVRKVVRNKYKEYSKL